MSAAAGVAVAWIDSRPRWDDTGVTVGLLVLLAATCGMLVPRHAWRWALAVGLWIPLHAIVTRGDFLMLVVLAFPFIGAYVGAAARRLGGALTGAG
ncbi:MAG TPA: hypothetical protein VG916_10195 [Gemmatimonadaceae bacterium]|nr:hypothetical protein [Gemmatimonadaceae bacterium]